MLQDNTFEFSLRQPIEVHGESAEVETLVFHECSVGYDHHYMKLRKLMLAGILRTPDLLDKFKKFLNDPDEDEEPALKGGSVVQRLHEVDEKTHEEEVIEQSLMMGMVLGSGDELEQLVKSFTTMIGLNGGEAICDTPGGVRLKGPAWERVHIEDKIEAAVQYCCFFGIGLESMQMSGSDTASESPTEVKAL